MPIEIRKTWETIYFTSGNLKTGYEVTVELTLNHETKTMNICQAGQEGIFFNKDSIGSAEERMKAIQAAVKHIKTLNWKL